jgi:hypothetical protein
MHVCLYCIPQTTSWLLGISPVIERGIINWDETFYSVGLEGTPNIVYIMVGNAISVALSSTILVIFILAIIGVSIIWKIPYVQDFIDAHTAIQEKPLQIVGLCTVFAFSVFFWIGYALSKIISISLVWVLVSVFLARPVMLLGRLLSP